MLLRVQAAGRVLTYTAAAAPQALAPSKWLRSQGGQGQIDYGPSAQEAAEREQMLAALCSHWMNLGYSLESILKLVWGAEGW